MVDRYLKVNGLGCSRRSGVILVAPDSAGSDDLIRIDLETLAAVAMVGRADNDFIATQCGEREGGGNNCEPRSRVGNCSALLHAGRCFPSRKSKFFLVVGWAPAHVGS